MLSMAPRRGNHGHGQGQHGIGNVLFGNFVDIPGYNHLALDHDLDHHSHNSTKCCCPTECLRETAVAGLDIDISIQLDDLKDVVRVVCNNEQCHIGNYMHRECFDNWEQTVLTYLKSSGRARSWSERQRHQNLWNKKGYDLAYKACGCKCGRGHLKKDLDWIAPLSDIGRVEDNIDNKKKKKKNKNQRPTLTHTNNNGLMNDLNRGRTGSLCSSNGSSSPPVSSEPSVSPAHSGSCGGCKKKTTNKVDFFSDRVKNGAAGNGIFFRRQDYTSFNLLPKRKLNAYHIKMEDEGNHGNDETRCFILSTLAAHQASRVYCVLCDSPMLVYDRYPLVDGTFFLSPRQHSKSCIEVKCEGRTQFLSAICMTCLEGWGAGRRLRCLYCASVWDGSSLVLGTMYSYDVFAAMPCCTERLRCNNCQKPLLQERQLLNFFSDYSHTLACPHCQAVDTHFVKPLGFCYTKDTLSQWP